MKLFTCEQLIYQYPMTRRPALRELSLSISAGEFVLLIGRSGSGKSTFLRALNGLVPRFYGGQIAGDILFAGQKLDRLTQRYIVENIGFLQQDPERQLLLDQVERELAFGLENLQIAPEQIRSRLAEVSHLFNLGHLLSHSSAQLSGGEKQRLALAGILATYPQVLLLDEPTSQLDPIHAEEVLHAVRRLNEEWGMTILMSEHRLDRCFHLADRLLLFEDGRITFDGSPASFLEEAKRHVPWQQFLPPISRHFLTEQISDTIPITVKEARQTTHPFAAAKRCESEGTSEALIPKPGLLQRLGTWWNTKGQSAKEDALLAISKGTAGYPEHPDVLRELTFSIRSGDRIALFGENGAGKSTLAKVLAGAVPLRKGELIWQDQVVQKPPAEERSRKVGYLSQNPNDYFLHDTVAEELAALDDADGRSFLDMLGLTPYLDRHPHDLSGGEKQRLALAIVLANRPRLLLLDEPTRGLDQSEKEKLVELLHALPVEATLLITHDVEFAARFANRVAILYRGQIVADGVPEQIFSQSFYYMPQVYKWRRQSTPFLPQKNFSRDQTRKRGV